MKLSDCKNSIAKLKGVGEAKKKLFNKIGIWNTYDLLTYYPKKYEDRINLKTFANLDSDDSCAIIVKILDHQYIENKNFKTLKIVVEDQNKNLGTIICFNRNFLINNFKIGKYFFIYGNWKYNSRYNEIQTTNFDFEQYSFSPKNFNIIKPIYNLTEGLTSNFILNIVQEAIKIYLPYIEEEFKSNIINIYGLQNIKTAIENIHLPKNYDILQMSIKTLKFVEFFNLYVNIFKKREERLNSYKKPFIKIAEHKISDRQQKIIDTLPFKMTEDQKQVLIEINDDIFSIFPMERLLQGDVGCGKSVVALLAAVTIFETGRQVAFLEPTEILAKQMADTAFSIFKNFGIRIALLTGSTNSENKKNLLKLIKMGEIDLIIGTHSLFSNNVQYKNLSLIIIDEQHKFGVNQRNALKEKGIFPDILSMSATPIPQTLALTLYGDLDISTIKTLPKNRKTVITHLAKMSNQNKVYDYIKKELAKKNQAYFIYPLINENDSLELKAAEEMAEKLSKQIFPQSKIALLHSKVDAIHKENIMKNFKEGKIDIIVATTVLEVGIDNPNATAIVIEHAQRFGLATLHQLRGRVGRGEKQSYCFLIYDDKLGEDSKKRMKIMLNTTDGFLIAEEDLKIRGPGELAGEKQSGQLKLKIADILKDTDLIKICKYEAQNYIKNINEER